MRRGQDVAERRDFQTESDTVNIVCTAVCNANLPALSLLAERGVPIGDRGFFERHGCPGPPVMAEMCGADGSDETVAFLRELLKGTRENCRPVEGGSAAERVLITAAGVRISEEDGGRRSFDFRDRAAQVKGGAHSVRVLDASATARPRAANFEVMPWTEF